MSSATCCALSTDRCTPSRTCQRSRSTSTCFLTSWPNFRFEQINAYLSIYLCIHISIDLYMCNYR